MEARHLVRQQDLIPASALATRISVVGAGGVGSSSVLAVAKMGFHTIQVIDFDRLEAANMSSQLYPLSCEGTAKVEALKRVVMDYTGSYIEASDKQWLPTMGPIALEGILVMAVDSLAGRAQLWQAHRDTNMWIIDPRMGAEELAVYAYHARDLEPGAGFGGEVYPLPCTAKSTIYTAFLVAGLVAKAVKDIATGKQPAPVLQWDVGANDYGSYR